MQELARAAENELCSVKGKGARLDRLTASVLGAGNGSEPAGLDGLKGGWGQAGRQEFERACRELATEHPNAYRLVQMMLAGRCRCPLTAFLLSLTLPPPAGRRAAEPGANR